MSVPALPLLDGWFAWLLDIVAPVSFLLTLGRPSARWRSWRLLVVAAVAMTVTGLLLLWLHLGQVVPYSYPPSFQLWLGFAVITLVMCVAGWSSAPWWRRVVSILAVISVSAWAANDINRYYGYYPTLADVFNRPVHNQVTPTDLAALNPEPSSSDVVNALTRPTVVISTGATSAPNDPTVTTVTTVDAGGDADVSATLPPITGKGAGGKVVSVTMPSSRSHFHHRPELVYLPPAWFATPRPRLPVLEMLAGVPGQPANWIVAAGALNVADTYAAGHHGVAPIMVFPDPNGSFTGDSECVDGPVGNAETYLTADVHDYIVSSFDAAPDPDHWAIVGLSEGGTCAVMLALRHPEMYHRFVDLSGDLHPTLGTREHTIARLFGGDSAAYDAHNPLTLLTAHSFPALSGWFEAGSHDTSKLAVARELAAAAQTAGIATHLEARAGGHNFRFWRAAWPDAFAWVTRQLGLD